MAIFKCKMCGGALEISEDITVAECEYCGSKQTVPTKKDEVITNLFNRANNLRLKNEFDKSAEVYNKILNENDADAEAHWGLVLCKYGIEYVEDPKTYKRIPTCHRTQYTSVLSDTDYLAAIENADVVSKEVYTAEAHEIAELQKSILAIVKDEKPFDVFICYKETDENGKRTVDSTLANDIYYQLTKEGLRVFYAAITLEDKLGVEYEPYIFAALNSAKVMLAIGTKPEYFNAVWVKNEWSRYLGIMKTDREKMLIPCYRDMDAYDLPEEFAHLQAQDMSKIGFINDLVRGIKKVTVKDVPKATENAVKETVVTEASTNIAPLLKRAFMFLEDSDWNSADEYCEKVLDIDPENAQAYLGKLMAELGVKNQGALKDQAEPFDDNNNYQKTIRFADETLKTAMIGYIEYINTRNKNTSLSLAYNSAKTTMLYAKSEEDYKKAAHEFEKIPGWEDSAKLAEECLVRAEDARKDAILDKAKSLKGSQHVSVLAEAIVLLKPISGWKDSDEIIVFCEERIAKLQEEAVQKKAELEKTKKQIIKKLKIATPIVTAIIILVILLNNVIIPNAKYNNAISLMEEGKYSEAVTAFEALEGYKDSTDKIIDCKYEDAILLANEGKYSEAIDVFVALYDYKDSADYLSRFKIYYDTKIEVNPWTDRNTHEYTYDSKGNMTKEVVYNQYDSISCTYEYIYDSEGNIVEKVHKTPYDQTSTSTKYTYNSKGEMIKKVYINTEDNIYITKYEYNYDSNGNITKRKETDSDGFISTYEYTYDNKGNVIKEYCSDGSYIEYSFDSKGNIIKSVETWTNGGVVTYEYTYFGEHIIYTP